MMVYGEKDKMKKESIKVINKEELMEKGQEIYEKIKNKLLPEHKGEILAIEIDSGDYFLGKEVIEAVNKAKEKYPDKIFAIFRIGYRAVYRI